MNEGQTWVINKVAAVSVFNHNHNGNTSPDVCQIIIVISIKPNYF